MKMNTTFVAVIPLCLLLVACGTGTRQATTGMSDNQLEDLVSRSHQYVAMYNVNNKGAMPTAGSNPDG
jgi:hypothetical protein